MTEFAAWLDDQMRVRRMSQRQLAVLSGVDHTTISRLRKGSRSPSLATAAALAASLCVEDGTPAIAFHPPTSAHPQTRVEYALRADPTLTEREVAEVMCFYLAMRAAR